MPTPSKKPDPHPVVAVAAISAMSIGVAVALELAGVTGVWDESLADSLGRLGLDGGMMPLAPWTGWLWTAVIVILSSWVLLHVRGAWRRWVLSVSVLIISLAWVPVLALCGRVPSLSAPLVGIIWALGGSLIYAGRHREPK